MLLFSLKVQQCIYIAKVQITTQWELFFILANTEIGSAILSENEILFLSFFLKHFFTFVLCSSFFIYFSHQFILFHFIRRVYSFFFFMLEIFAVWSNVYSNCAKSTQINLYRHVRKVLLSNLLHIPYLKTR